MPTAERVLIEKDPFNISDNMWDCGKWRASWIGPAGRDTTQPVVLAFRRKLRLGRATKVRIHVSADERYRLFLDGGAIGRGPERGSIESWFYESYDVTLSAGAHTLVAQVWWLGPRAPSAYAQLSVQPAFLLAAEGSLAKQLDTGVAQWQVKELGGYHFLPPGYAWGTGAKLRINAAEFCWGFETGTGGGWKKPVVIERATNAATANEYGPVWLLRPAILPPMLQEVVRPGVVRHVQAVKNDKTQGVPVRAKDHLPEESPAWQALMRGAGALRIPPRTRRRVIVDLDNYYCAYPCLTTSRGRGARIRIGWAEGLFKPARRKAEWWTRTKGNRNEIEGKVFDGVGDVFEPDGGAKRKFRTLWWEAGRYVEIVVETAAQELVIEDFHLRQTHYPYDFVGAFAGSDPSLEEVIGPAIRTLEMCSHETYMDCPYYEQLQYAGDTRLEVLVTYATCRDDSLPRKALVMFDRSRVNRGVTMSRYPARVTQIIPPFSLYWVAMIHDFLMWRGGRAFVLDRMNGARSVLEHFRTRIGSDGLLRSPVGWNFMDWVKDWPYGCGPGGADGFSGLLNWHLVYTLERARELEDYAGEPSLARRNAELAAQLVSVIDRHFWDEARGLYADDLEHKFFSEHAQCFALLSGLVPQDKRARVIDGLVGAPDLTRTTIYFRHYLFEAFRAVGRMDLMQSRMEPWFELKKLGCRTTLEAPEPSRSDCHAWASHPLYHYLASVLGIRPAAPEFARVRIEPQLGSLTSASGTMAHPRGVIKVDLRIEAGRLKGAVELPGDLPGEFVYNGRELALTKPRQTFEIAGS